MYFVLYSSFGFTSWKCLLMMFLTVIDYSVSNMYIIFMNINTFPFLHISLEKFPIHIQQLDRWQNSWTGQKDNSHKKPIPFYYS